MKNCKNTDKQFCFIVPFYNAEKFISICAKSIYCQNYAVFRVIFINDASTDGSQTIIDEFTKKYNNIFCINNKINYGPAYSRFVGIQETSNDEILIFLDGDDWLFSPTVLEYLNNIYQENVEMTVGSYKKYDGKKSIFTSKVCTININKPTRYHLRSGYAYLWKNMPYEFILDENKQLIRYLTDFNEILWAIKQTNKIFYCMLPLSIYNTTGNSTEFLPKEYKISLFKNISNKCQPLI